MNTTLCHKNDRVCRNLLEAIRNGTLQPGARLPGERELAEQNQCSRVTIRRALEKLEEQRVVRRLQGDGTYVSGGAFRPETDFRVALLLNAEEEEELYNDPWLTELLCGIISAGRRYAFNINVVPTRRGEEFHLALENRGQTLSDYDGFIAAKGLSEHEIEILCAGSHPFVTLQIPDSNQTVSYVSIDNRQGGYLAGAHLLSIGCRHIHYIGMSTHGMLGRNQQEGFRQAIREYGLSDAPGDVVHLIGSDDYTESERIIDEMIEKKIPFDGFLIGTDGGTYSVVTALRRHGLRIPEDVSIIMWDDFPWVSKVLRLPLTVVRQPFQEQLASAIGILMKNKDTHNIPNIQQIMQPSLVVRCSCRTPNANHLNQGV